MTSAYRNCQSCGMPLKRDEHGGGTEADGSRSAMYCSHCYQNGRFTMPNLSAEEMQERVRGKMVQMGFPRFMSGLFTRGIPRLERWQT